MLPLELMSGSAAAQRVPEGIHTPAAGPESICGITGSSARDFRAKVEEAGLKAEDAGSRFELFTAESEKSIVRWAFARQGEPAFPLATCRNLYQTADGSWMMKRSMRRDASRAACDDAFIEFNELNRKVQRELQGAAR